MKKATYVLQTITMLAVLLMVLLTACPQKVNAVKTSASIQKLMMTVVPVSFVVQPGDSFIVSFSVNTTVIYHSIGMDVTWPACMTPISGSFKAGNIFAGQGADIICNEFTAKLYVAATVGLGKAGDSGERVIGAYKFIVVGAGSGTIVLNDVKALRYNNAAPEGYDSLPTAKEDLQIVFAVPTVELVTVKVTISKL